ncbi:MAG: hypothetical protein GXP62_20065 [Oligoflexia bacterium]|nr:hypothetical protein [Oligoflexia bacterium]
MTLSHSHPSLAHARACLSMAARHPLALIFAVLAPVATLPIAAVLPTLPTPMLVMLAAASGGLGDVLLRGLLVRSDRFPRDTKGALAHSTLPISPRQRAVGEALAAVPILAAAAAVLALVSSCLPLDWQSALSETGQSEMDTRVVFALLAMLVPAVVGASLQAGQGTLSQLLGLGLPGAALALCWRLGLVASPIPLAALLLVCGGLLLALGPLPQLRITWRPQRSSQALSRPANAPSIALTRDFWHGLLWAHIKASPLLAIGILPWLLVRGQKELGPTFYLGIGVAAVAMTAAMMPLGHTTTGTGSGQASPWASLPLDRHRLARRLYAHALLCMVLLPSVLVSLTIIAGLQSRLSIMFLVLLGLPIAPPLAAALTGAWLVGWRRAALAAVGATLVLALLRVALADPSTLPLAAVALISVLAGVLPVADLLRPQRLAPVAPRM